MKKSLKQAKTKTTIEGIIRVDSRATGRVVLPDGHLLLIESADLNTALDGDTVALLLHPARQKTELHGEVTRIIKRKRLEFVGILQTESANGHVNFVSTEDRRMYVDIIIPAGELHGAKEGQKVLAIITKWTDSKKEPLGKITRVLGEPGDNNVEMESILLEKGFQPEFSAQILNEAQAAKERAQKLFDQEISQRRDFRAITTFTVDPIDAKDFDDALSFQEVKDGCYEVGVHIADVSFFVRPGTELDREAEHRATSIYLVDRTIPMLPEVLSNDICSLKPKEDRLAFSAVFTITKDGAIKNQWFGKSIINSNQRFTYEEVQQILDTNQGPFAEELSILNAIAYKLREKKIEAGAISFEDEEVKFRLDKNGKPLDVYKNERTDSHKLIEDFMLLANKRVAEYVSKINKNQARTFVYRVHESPDMEKIHDLQEFLKPLGYNLKIRGKSISSIELNSLLTSSLGSAEENMVQRAAVRAMQKAVYSTVNIGHYGLAFPHYTHFTSPIRRYPDLMVHRLLEIYLAHKKPSQEMLKQYSELAIHCSEMERQATEAERDSIKYKQVEYMQGKVGQIFSGVISGVSEWGIYVEELETKAEGMVRLSDLKDDYYVLDEKNFALKGSKTKKKYRLGDVVKFEVKKADLNRKILDFILI